MFPQRLVLREYRDRAHSFDHGELPVAFAQPPTPPPKNKHASTPAKNKQTNTRSEVDGVTAQTLSLKKIQLTNVNQQQM